MQLIEHNIVSCLYKISIQHEYQEVTSSNIARFLSSRQMFFTLSLVLAVILYNSVSNLTLAEKDLLEHRLIDGKGDCFDRCTKLPSAKQKVEDANCRLCLNERRRKKRSIGDQATYYDCKPTRARILQEIGNITDIAVNFTEHRLQNGTVDWWAANLTWEVSFLNSSLYMSNIWSGFEIRLVKGTENNAAIDCGFHNKSATWTIIEKLSKSDFPLYVLITFYPPSKSLEEEKLTMLDFSPNGILNTKTPSPTAFSYSDNPNTIKMSSPSTTTTDKLNKTKKSIASTTDKADTSHRIYYISGAVALGVLVGVALLLAVYVHRKRLTGSSRIYAPVDPSNTKYDTSIIFSSKDEKFIVRKLLPFLEQENNFRCCVHFRDWEPGEFVPCQMVKMVYNCRKVIAVISKHFLASHFCQEELNMALGRLANKGDASLIVINLGVALEDLPPALQNRTFLDLTSSTEKKTWRSRLERQISAENSNTACSDIAEDNTERNNWTLNEREESFNENTVRTAHISRASYGHINDSNSSSNSESSL